MTSTNANLHKARGAKNDEFYTQFADIAKEMKHYKQHFKGKTILCNCDNPTQSAFWKYFHLNFAELSIKKLISSHYSQNEPTYKMEYEGGNDNDVTVGIKTPFEGNGDFRNMESIELLKESDIVVTNPPFSLFRPYVAQLMEYDKKFVILGNMNAITYKEVFPYLKDNKIWLGYKSLNQDMYFDVPDECKKWLLANKKEGSAYKFVNGIVMGRLASACWFTNLDHTKRHEKLVLRKNYIPEEYPKYDNYDAINVNKVSDIPIDYDGVMGVPITFMDKYNPDQFEIVEGSNRYGILNTWGKNEDIKKHHSHGNNINGKATYFRIHIRKKQSHDEKLE